MANPMRIFAVKLAILSLLGASAANAADTDYRRAAPRTYDRVHERMQVLPFPRSERAQSVWESGTCWSECGAQTAWGIPACLRVDPQGECLAWADAGDRYCQRQCRTSGGPLLGPLLPLFDW